MQAGRLRERITIQRPVRVSDGHGGMVLSWADVATVWAEVVPLNGRELLLAGQMQSAVNMRVRMRYRAGVGADMRAKLPDGRLLYFGSVIDVEERHREFEILCQEKQP